VSVLPPGIQEGDFELIQAAVRETERGRWFLDEFASRVRANDADRIAAAIKALESRLAEAQATELETRLQLETVVSVLSAFAETLGRQQASGPGRPTP